MYTEIVHQLGAKPMQQFQRMIVAAAVGGPTRANIAVIRYVAICLTEQLAWLGAVFM
jgi:hypothetical protein